jgi:Autophagy-related protein C terminal domain
VFVTLADCNVDYTPPAKFVHSSRAIIRVSEVRFSSNIVSPAGSVQAYRLTVGDINLLLCNQRYPYNSENRSLPRSSNLLPQEELMVKASRGVNIEHDMNLITMLTLDSVNGIITRTSQAENENDPGITANFAFGTLCVYGCKDSFECLINTISEWNLYATGLSDEVLHAMKAKATRAVANVNEPGEQFFDSLSDEQGDGREVKVTGVSNERAVMSQVEQSVSRGQHSFNLDGYDWTTVDHGWSRQGAKSVELQPGEDQVAKWYVSDEPAKDENTKIGVGPALRIIPHHVRIHETSDSLIQGDMDAATHAGTQRAPPVTSRVLVRDLKLRCRFFDGYDWPRYVKRQFHATARHYKFIIDDTMDRKKEGEAKTTGSDVNEKMPKLAKDEKKSRLMGALLDCIPDDHDDRKTFENTPLPEERAVLIRDFAEERRLARRMNRFLQISLSGVRARVDVFSESTEHRLASCLDLKVTDLFVAETISDLKPVKLVGEWFNEVEHPRDTNDGLVMMKMVTWRPVERVTPENEIANDESHAVVHVLPLRCHIDQRALRFARAFFTSGEETPPLKWATTLTDLPPPKFTWFKVKACKMKVDYSPEKVDVEALRDGSIVELINLSPLTDMVIGLQAVELEDKVGFGAVIGELASSWVKDIVATQMYKFVTYSSVFQPFSSVGGGVADMVILPWDAIRNGEEVSKAFRSGVSSFGETLAFETLNTTAKLTNFAAQQLNKTLASSLPSRPQDTPRGVGETATYAMESLARGLDHANYKIVVVPYKEFQDKGAASAAKSIVRGIPVAILAPLAGVNEAMSYTLLGARNTLRPNIRKEEESSQRGLHSDF